MSNFLRSNKRNITHIIRKVMINFFKYDLTNNIHSLIKKSHLSFNIFY